MNCSFTGNTAIIDSGAISFSTGNDNSWTGCSFTNNTATDYRGGAIYFSSGSSNNNCWVNCSFTGNTANRGGAIYFYSSSSNCWLNCSFIGNTATDGGGAISSMTGNDNNWSGCTFANNTANNGGGGGGAIDLDSGNDNTWSGCTFINNTATSSNKGGGAISSMTGNNNTWTGCNFTNNAASYGGAISSMTGNNNTWTGCNFTNNAASYGGAIYFYSGDNNSWVNCSFTGNTVTMGSGSAIYLDSGDNNSWMGCNFTNNNANSGGAIWFNSGSSNNTWSGCTFTNNTASSSNNGGAISFMTGNNNTWMGCTFTNNTASSSNNGGAISFSTGNDNSWMGCNFTNNNANSGGAIYLYSGTGNNVNYCIIENNKANTGSAIYGGGSVDLDYNFFAFQNNIIEFPSGLIEGASPNNWVVLNITESKGEYVVSFVLNDSSSLNEIMLDYEAVLSENGDVRDIVVKNNVWSGPVYKSGDVTACVNSPVTGALLTSITIKEVEIVLPEDPVFVVGAGENYTAVIKSGGEVIGASFTVVLELVNGGNRKNYTLTTDDKGSISLPIYRGYAKVYTFNIYFDAQGNYLANAASQDIIIVPLSSSLITDYVDDKMDSTVYSGDYWTAKLVDNNGNAIVNTNVEVHFKKEGADEKVYIVKSDVKGNVKLQLNLSYTGDYIIYAKFKGTSKYASSESHNITVTINKGDVKLVTNYTNNTLFTTPNSGEEFKVQLFTVNDKVVKGVKLKINFTNSKGDGNVYNVTVKDDGFAHLTLNLSYVGKYFATVFFEVDLNYNPSQDSSITSIIVEKID